MTSRAFCCNGTLLRKNITRFWPLWAMLTLALLVGYPLILSVAISSQAESAADTLYSATFSYGIVLTFGYAIVSAACLFNYLHNTRSAYMLHAFPVTRDSLLLTNVLSGLLFFMVPWTGVCGLSLLLIAPAGNAALQALLLCWLALLLVYLFFFGLAVLCMFVTGKTVSGVLIYGVLNFIVVLVEYLLRLVIEPALYGFDDLGNAISMPATPVAYLVSEVLSSVSIGESYYDRVYYIDWLYIGILAVLGLGFLVAAWAIYRRRHMEQAGEVITVKWARPIYQVIFSLIGALTIGLFIAVLLTNGDIGESLPTLLLSLCFGGFIGHFLAEMRLKKSVKVFRGAAFLRFGCFATVLCLFVLSFYNDWFGIVRRVPATDKIVTVEIENLYNSRGVITLDTTEEIEELRALHKGILDQHNNGEEFYGSYYLDGMRITYRLKDGSTLTRSYCLGDLEDDPELLAQAEALLERPEYVIEYYDSLRLREARMIEAYAMVKESGFFVSTTLSPEDCERLLEAFYQDTAAGNISVFFGWISEYDYEITFLLPDGRYYHMDVPYDAVHTRAVLDTVEFPEEK